MPVRRTGRAPTCGFPTPHAEDGAIAQLGERLNGIQEVGGSTPPGSTRKIKYLGPLIPYYWPENANAGNARGNFKTIQGTKPRTEAAERCHHHD
jgi:hypothetical protein